MDQTDAPQPSRAPRRASRSLAAFLSFLVPGTGQFLTGRVRAGLLFFLPIALAIVAALVVATGDRGKILGFMVEPSVLLGLVALDGVILIWRVAAIIDAWRGAGSGTPRTAVSTIVVVALLAVTGATHYVIGAQVMAAHDTVQAVFASSDDGGDDGFGEIPDPTPVPSPTPTPGPARLLRPRPPRPRRPHRPRGPVP